jgi:hypothetical protein
MTAMRLPGWIGQRALEGAPCALELCVDDRAVAELRWCAEAHRRGEAGWSWRRVWPVPEPGFSALPLASPSSRRAGDEELALEAELLTANRAVRFVLALLACDVLSGVPRP